MSERATMGGKPVFTVPNKTVINFNSGFAPKLLCDGATFTAGTACPYSCSFCSVPTTMRKHMPWLRKQGVVGEHHEVVVRRANAVEIARQQILSRPAAFRQRQQVIYASPLTDVAANMELVRETVEICKVILELTNWDIRLLSKSNLLPKVALGLAEVDPGNAQSGYPSRVIYGVSTGTLDDKLAATFEEGTAKVSKRLESLHWLQDNGFRTFGMICPSLPHWEPGVPDAIAYQHWAESVHQAIHADRCEHVWAEVINLRGDSFTKTVSALQTAGYGQMAAELQRVSVDKAEWERYARLTFEAHAPLYQPGQLRFLQYVTKDTEPYWRPQAERGAVLL